MKEAGFRVEALPARKVRIEFYDASGTRHTITLEGEVTREKVGRILDYIELMGGAPSTGRSLQLGQPRTKMERVLDLIASRFQDRTFLSSDIQRAYAETFGEEVPISTVATYLSRLADRGLLNRMGSSAGWRYALAPARQSPVIP